MKMKKVFLPVLVAIFAFALMFTSNQAMAAEKAIEKGSIGAKIEEGGTSASASYRYVTNCTYYVSMKKSASSSSKTIATVPYAHRVTYLGKKGSYSKVKFYNVMNKKTYTGYIKSSYLTSNIYFYYTDAYKAFMKWRGMNGAYYSYCLGPYDSSQGGCPPALITSNYSKSSGRTIFMYVYINGAVKRVEFNGKAGKYTLTPSGKWILNNNGYLAYKQSTGKYRVLSWTSMTKAKLVTKKVSSKYMETLSFKKFK